MDQFFDPSYINSYDWKCWDKHQDISSEDLRNNYSSGESGKPKPKKAILIDFQVYIPSKGEFIIHCGGQAVVAGGRGHQSFEGLHHSWAYS